MEDLKQYLKLVKDLECSIYSQQEYIKSLTDRLDGVNDDRLKTARTSYSSVLKTRPEKPDISSASSVSYYAEEPILSFAEYIYKDELKAALKFIIFILAICVLPGAAISLMSGGRTLISTLQYGALIGGVIDGIYIIGALFKTVSNYNSYVKEKRRINDYRKSTTVTSQSTDEEVLRKYELDLGRYNQALDAAKKRMDYAEKDVQKRRVYFNSEVLPNLNKALSESKAMLEQLYSADIVHPKYRGMAKICTIYDYIDTGRCYTLEGPDGAYNLFELELRSDRVIGELGNISNKLDTISNKLDIIAENQYTLFLALNEINSQLAKTNEAINEVCLAVSGLKKAVSLNNYYAKLITFNTTAQENMAKLGFTYHSPYFGTKVLPEYGNQTV